MELTYVNDNQRTHKKSILNFRIQFKPQMMIGSFGESPTRTTKQYSEQFVSGHISSAGLWFLFPLNLKLCQKFLQLAKYYCPYYSKRLIPSPVLRFTSRLFCGKKQPHLSNGSMKRELQAHVLCLSK